MKLNSSMWLHTLWSLLLFLCTCLLPGVSSASSSRSSSPCLSGTVETPVGFPKAFRSVVMSQVGVREIRCNNCGKDVNKYQRAAGIAINRDPYCQAGNYWCASEALRILGYPDSLNPFVRTGLASLARRELQTHWTPGPVEPLYLLYWQYPSSANGHVDDCIAIHDGGWIKCVSFNSGSGSSRDGIGGGAGVNITYRNPSHPLSRMFARARIQFV
jgi:hypothetical protein